SCLRGRAGWVLVGALAQGTRHRGPHYHASSVAASREHGRAKTDRLDRFRVGGGTRARTTERGSAGLLIAPRAKKRPFCGAGFGPAAGVAPGAVGVMRGCET